MLGIGVLPDAGNLPRGYRCLISRSVLYKHRAAQRLGQFQRQPPPLREVVESAGGSAAQLAVALASSLDTVGQSESRVDLDAAVLL
jgi:hypothetical protein